MLPENQFHAAPSKINKTDYYNTQQVLEKTLMSRFTLIRKVKNNEFPKPIVKKRGENKQQLYKRDAVDQWMTDNSQFVSERKQKRYPSINVNFTPSELKLIETASQALGCDPEFFINDAALWKARGVLKRLEYENN